MCAERVEGGFQRGRQSGGHPSPSKQQLTRLTYAFCRFSFCSSTLHSYPRLLLRMSIYSSGHPPLPSLHPHPEYSFYPYPITPRSQLHSTLQSSYPSPSSPSIRGLAGYSQGPSAPASIRGEAGPSTSRTKVEDRALRRAEKRAVRGLRPSGVGLGREAEDLSEEEVMMEDEKVSLQDSISIVKKGG